MAGLFGFMKGRPDVPRLQSNRNVSGLVQALAFPDSEIAGPATRALASLGLDALEPLLSALASTDSSMRRNAAISLAHWGNSNPLVMITDEWPGWIVSGHGRTGLMEVEFDEFVGKIIWCNDPEAIDAFFSIVNPFTFSVSLNAVGRSDPNFVEKMLPYWKLHGRAGVIGIVSQLSESHNDNSERFDNFIKILSGPLTDTPELRALAMDTICDLSEKLDQYKLVKILDTMLTPSDQRAIQTLKGIVANNRFIEAIELLARIREFGSLLPVLNWAIDNKDFSATGLKCLDAMRKHGWVPANRMEEAIEAVLRHDYDKIIELGCDGLRILTRHAKEYERQQWDLGHAPLPHEEDPNGSAGRILQLFSKQLKECIDIDEETLSNLAGLRIWLGAGTSYDQWKYELDTPELKKVRELAQSRLGR